MPKKPTASFPFDDEEFIEVEGLPQYLASTYGRVFSCKSRKFLKPTTIGGGGPRISVSNNGRQASLPLAVIILTAFGKRPPRPDAVPAWVDRDTQNCALDNLLWK